MMRHTALLALFSLFLAAQPAAAADTLPELPVAMPHTGTFNGQRLSYEAVIEAIEVPAPRPANAQTKAKSGARIVSMSYLAGKTENRPVVFAFNGGPIASSYGVQMGLLGPRNAAVPKDAAAKTGTPALRDNPQTVLDLADLVFYDPAGTGFSRAIDGVPLHGYYNDTADAQEFADFVVAWCKKHDRVGAPVYIMGESYGTMRAALAAGLLTKSADVRLAGVILIGQAVNAVEYSQRPANIVSYVVSLPTLAAVALHYGKISSGGKSTKDFLEEVYRFAGSDYLPALFRGRRMAPSERREIAERLEAYSGIPAGYYLAHDLRITKYQFHKELLKDRGLITGMSNGSYALPEAAHLDPAHIINDTYVAAVRAYLQKDFGITDAQSYITLIDEKDSENWAYAGSSDPFGKWPYESALGSAFAKPDFRLMVVGGYYDLETTFGAARYMLEGADWPADRISFRIYPGGHMVYADDHARKLLLRDLRAFLAAGAKKAK